MTVVNNLKNFKIEENDGVHPGRRPAPGRDDSEFDGAGCYENLAGGVSLFQSGRGGAHDFKNRNGANRGPGLTTLNTPFLFRLYIEISIQLHDQISVFFWTKIS